MSFLSACRWPVGVLLLLWTRDTHIKGRGAKFRPNPSLHRSVVVRRSSLLE